jgi:hypothetical protein
VHVHVKELEGGCQILGKKPAMLGTAITVSEELPVNVLYTCKTYKY